jgi:protein-tyrosine phosphatase
MFDAMMEERVPMLIHCTAGKDRTGVGSMLILMALGADERVLRKDYMITNTYRWDAVQRFLDARKDEIGDNEELRNAMIAYEGVREEAVDIVLQTILSRYESIEAYLEGEFGLDDLALQQLQEMYLA